MHNDAHVQIYKNMSLSHITHQINPCMSFTWYLHNQTTFQSFTMLIFTQGIGIELLSDQHRSGSPFRYRGLNSNRIQHLFKVGLLLPSEESWGPPHYLLDRGVSPVSISCTSAVKSPIFLIRVTWASRGIAFRPQVMRIVSSPKQRVPASRSNLTLCSSRKSIPSIIESFRGAASWAPIKYWCTHSIWSVYNPLPLLGIVL